MPHYPHADAYIDILRLIFGDHIWNVPHFRQERRGTSCVDGAG